MDLTEAQGWIEGINSTVNIMPIEPMATVEVRIAQADAAKTEQAYWILRAVKEGLLSCGNGGKGGEG